MHRYPVRMLGISAAVLMFLGSTGAAAAAAPVPPPIPPIALPPVIVLPPPLLCHGEQSDDSSDTDVPLAGPPGVEVQLDTVPSDDFFALYCVDVEVHIVHPNRNNLRVELIEPDGDVRLLHSPGGPAGANLDRTYRRLVDSSGEFTLRVQDAVGKVSGHLDRWRLHGYYQAV